MKIIALGDTHGRDNWKKIVANNDFDKVIFIGDYFDSREGVSAEKQISNFEEIVKYKKSHPNKVVLLYGNHDHHYNKAISETYSNFQDWHKTNIKKVLNSALDEKLIQICFVHGNMLFVHAGVTKTWCKANNIDLNNLQTSINNLLINKPTAFNFTVGNNYDNYGDDICQTPIWVRPRSLYIDKIPNYLQIIGHTTQDKISGLSGSRKVYTQGMTVETSGVVFIDTLGTSGEYLEINNGTYVAKKP